MKTETSGHFFRLGRLKLIFSVFLNQIPEPLQSAVTIWQQITERRDQQNHLEENAFVISVKQQSLLALALSTTLLDTNAVFMVSLSMVTRSGAVDYRIVHCRTRYGLAVIRL